MVASRDNVENRHVSKRFGQENLGGEWRSERGVLRTTDGLDRLRADADDETLARSELAQTARPRRSVNFDERQSKRPPACDVLEGRGDKIDRRIADQPRDKIVARLEIEIAGRADLDNATLPQHADPIPHAERF